MALRDTLRLSWLNGLTDSTGVRTWNTDKLFSKSRVTVSGVQSGRFDLYVGNGHDCINYYAHEADRFAAASFESLLAKAASQHLPRSFGWSLIQAYYSAFFATHALFRFAGWSCTRLSTENLRSINNEIITLYSGSAFPNGLYLLKASDGGRTITCEGLGAHNGGSHEALWALIPSYLAHVKNMALGLPNINANDTDPIDRLEKFITSKGGAGWFSTVRNRLNYSHAYGAWHPYLKSTCAPENIENALNEWLGDIDGTGLQSGTDELMHFSKACAMLVGLCRITTHDIAYRSKSKSPFKASSGRLISIAMQR